MGEIKKKRNGQLCRHASVCTVPNAKHRLWRVGEHDIPSKMVCVGAIGVLEYDLAITKTNHCFLCPYQQHCCSDSFPSNVQRKYAAAMYQSLPRAGILMSFLFIKVGQTLNSFSCATENGVYAMSMLSSSGSTVIANIAVKASFLIGDFNSVHSIHTSLFFQARSTPQVYAAG